jgi:hypothetical protein
MVEESVFHIVIVPMEKPDPNVVNTVAAIIRKEPYTTRMLLTGKIPKLASHYGSLEEAAEIKQSLQALGLAVFISHSSFLNYTDDTVFRAFTLDIGKDAITFRNQGGKSRITGKEDVFLIIRFNKQHVIVNKSTTTRLKFSLGKTLMTGGIPMFNQEQETTTAESAQTEMVLRLYNRVSPEHYVELAQQNMDFSFLGEKRGYSSKANFNTVVNVVRKAFSGAIFNDDLVFFSGMKAAADTDEAMEVNCRLLYQYYRDYDGNPAA